MLTLIQTRKMEPVPVILVGEEFWNPIVDWLRATALERYETISPEDLDLFQVVNTAEDAFGHIKDSPERKYF